MLGLGYRNKYEITEDKDLTTALEVCLYKKNYSKFEIIYKHNCMDGNIMLVNIVIMRNIQLILETPQLDILMRDFFNDNEDNQNPVRFAMLLPQENLPTY